MSKTKTNTVLIMLVAALAMFLLTTAVFSAEPANGVGKQAASQAAAKSPQQRTVRCDRGERLQPVLRRARRGSTIRVRGTCMESVRITTDALTIVGVGDARIDGSGAAREAVVLIDGARGFALKRLTVQNGADQGIIATRQARGSLRNVTIVQNGTVGLTVDRSHLEIKNMTLDANGASGMDAFAGSTVVMFGTIRANDNGGSGLVANGKTFLEVRGAEVVTDGNGGTGVSIINDSRLQIFSFPEAQGSTIQATNNGFAGIGLAGAELSVVGEQFFGSGANVITASNNTLFGFFMPAGGIFSPHATAKFVASGNRVGMLMEDGARALVVGGLDVTGNGAGVSAVGAGTLTLVSVPPNPSTVDANLLDFDLGFGTRATIDGVTATSVNCDGTNLLRGSLSCP